MVIYFPPSIFVQSNLPYKLKAGLVCTALIHGHLKSLRSAYEPRPNGSSTLQLPERGNTIEIRNRIISTRDCHIYKFCQMQLQDKKLGCWVGVGMDVPSNALREGGGGDYLSLVVLLVDVGLNSSGDPDKNAGHATGIFIA